MNITPELRNAVDLITRAVQGAPVPPIEPTLDPGLAYLRINAAADYAGVSRSTIRRRHEDGLFPRATKDQWGAWLIPTADLDKAFTERSAAKGDDQEASGSDILVEFTDETSLTVRAYRMDTNDRSWVHFYREDDRLVASISALRIKYITRTN